MMHSPSSVLVLMTAALFLSVPALAAPENPPLPKEAGMDFGTAIQSCYPQPAGLNDAEQRFAHHLITGLWSVRFFPPQSFPGNQPGGGLFCSKTPRDWRRFEVGMGLGVVDSRCFPCRGTAKKWN